MAKVQTRKSISVSREVYDELSALRHRTGRPIAAMVEAAIRRECPPVPEWTEADEQALAVRK